MPSLSLLHIRIKSYGFVDEIKYTVSLCVCVRACVRACARMYIRKIEERFGESACRDPVFFFYPFCRAPREC